ncbi:MAG: VacJ family lipoprotein [Gammaproteobacteria bacterium]|nr:VacJ family lipoprotein [Gammaproteobacteria bacterium]
MIEGFLAASPRFLLRLLPVLLGLVMSHPAFAQENEKNPDPWEGMNRKVQKFNDGADRYVLRPLAVGYTKVVPRFMRRGVSNFFNNLTYPVVVVNQFLQGKWRDGFADTGRFLVNSTLGIGGLFDPASRAGLDAHEEDFGQTFAKWGVASGPYLVVPFRGPATIRDGGGAIVDSAMFPPRYSDDVPLRNSLTGLYFLDQRAALLDVDQLVSGDRYTFMRDAYLQRREFLILDGEVEDSFMDEEWED